MDVYLLEMVLTPFAWTKLIVRDDWAITQPVLSLLHLSSAITDVLWLLGYLNGERFGASL